MPGNAVLKIEHDTQAIYYLCVLNLGYRIVCATISFWSCGKCILDTLLSFSLHVDYVGEQAVRKWCMGGEDLRQIVQIMLHTNQEMCWIHLCWNTTALCCECCLMSEQSNLSWCNLSPRNFSHRTDSESDTLQMWSSHEAKKTTASE